MPSPSIELLHEQLALADALLAGRKEMFDPQDLPGRYGRVIGAIDRVLGAIDCEAVVGGGLATRIRQPRYTTRRHCFTGRSH
jgi:hypothetical protein